MDKPICFDGVFRFDADCGTPMYNTFSVQLVRPEPDCAETYLRYLQEALHVATERLAKDCRHVLVVYLAGAQPTPYTRHVYEVDTYKDDPYLVTYRSLRKVISPRGFNHIPVPL